MAENFAVGVKRYKNLFFLSQGFFFRLRFFLLCLLQRGSKLDFTLLIHSPLLFKLQYHLLTFFFLNSVNVMTAIFHRPRQTIVSLCVILPVKHLMPHVNIPMYVNVDRDIRRRMQLFVSPFAPSPKRNLSALMRIVLHPINVNVGRATKLFQNTNAFQFVIIAQTACVNLLENVSALITTRKMNLEVALQYVHRNV